MRSVQIVWHFPQHYFSRWHCVYYLLYHHMNPSSLIVSSSSDCSTPKRPKISPVVWVSFHYCADEDYVTCVARGEKYICSADEDNENFLVGILALGKVCACTCYLSMGKWKRRNWKATTESWSGKRKGSYLCMRMEWCKDLPASPSVTKGRVSCCEYPGWQQNVP